MPTSKPVRLPVKRIAPAGLKVSMAAGAALVATLPTCYGWVCRLPFTLAAGLVSIAVDASARWSIPSSEAVSERSDRPPPGVWRTQRLGVVRRCGAERG